mmetsp:Transcript_875/g.1238  ORF Transcript_875/g.1238 Transcript_875/m.1238 type:complete len:121 (+) Transcript_875:224-586(+)
MFEGGASNNIFSRLCKWEDHSSYSIVIEAVKQPGASSLACLRCFLRQSGKAVMYSKSFFHQLCLILKSKCKCYCDMIDGVGPDKFRLSLIGMANPGKEKRFAFKRRGSPVRYIVRSYTWK